MPLNTPLLLERIKGGKTWKKEVAPCLSKPGILVSGIKGEYNIWRVGDTGSAAQSGVGTPITFTS